MPPVWERTRVVKKLSATQAGARKLAHRYGDDLVCVRYRHDADGLRRYTTVELVVDSGPVMPRKGNPARMVEIRIGIGEKELRREAMKLGAVWDPGARVWRMPRAAANKLGFTAQLVWGRSRK